MYEVFQGGTQGDWFFRFRAPNGEIQCQSEAYPSKANAERGARDLYAANLALAAALAGAAPIVKFVE